MPNRRRRPPRELRSLPPRTLVTRHATADFNRVVDAAAAVEAAEIRLQEAVARAIHAGGSWAMVGAALGTSRQNAYQQFAAAVGPVDPRMKVPPRDQFAPRDRPPPGEP